MCLSKPQKVISFSEGYAIVRYMGKEKKVRSPIALKPGEYVICQSNVVAHRIPEKQAKEMLREWKKLNEWG
ncbi:MAG: hypothetical protein DRO99_04455 [Candidatus Aenigmatarchaeota archaeon]|nr:MAG: hypothetical protein DRO99_04455 [Candidatus Aenigmarchaeota archaeon]